MSPGRQVMTKLDEKLARIRAGKYKRSDFIIADAKDGDMGAGVLGAAPKRAPDGTRLRGKTRAEYLDDIAAVVKQGIVDVMLVSASNLELLHERGVFKKSKVKPVIRANDTTDCWGLVRHGVYPKLASRPFRTASLPRVMYNAAAPLKAPGVKKIYGTDLGLYSITMMNDLEADLRTMEAFRDFRAEAALNGFKYFLEVFNPNTPHNMEREHLGEFINDSLLRCLAGVMKADRPQFLKIVYNGPKALEELAAYDPDLVIGILGGGGGTNRDTFELLHQAERYGARVALFGRKINQAEAPLTLLTFMRKVTDGTITPEEAVRAYHGELQKLGLKPFRSLEEDRVITEEPLKKGMLKAA
jgi:hypothetical protein